MDIDFAKIEQTVIENFSNKFYKGETVENTYSELCITIATISAKVMTDYFQEYLKAIDAS